MRKKREKIVGGGGRKGKILIIKKMKEKFKKNQIFLLNIKRERGGSAREK